MEENHPSKKRKQYQSPMGKVIVGNFAGMAFGPVKLYQSPMGKVIERRSKITAQKENTIVSIPYGEGNRTTFCVVLQIIEQDIAFLPGNQFQHS